MNENTIPGGESEIQRKHRDQMHFHEQTWGAPLGELANEPTKKQLDQDFERRRKAGELFSQQTEKQESSPVTETD